MRLRVLSAMLFLAIFTSLALANKGPTSPRSESGPQKKQLESAIPAAGEEINWTSVNCGGAIGSSSTNFRLSASVAQSVIGFATSTNYQMGIGFWYGEGLYCIARPGDADASGDYSLGDVIKIVNYIFDKPYCTPRPRCWLSGLLCRGDWDANGGVSLGDAIIAVNYLFAKPGGPWNAKAIGACCLP